jgi:hypothetical protein
LSIERKEIRNKVVEILKRSKIVDVNEIRANRSIVYDQEKLPSISVYTRNESTESVLSDAPVQLKRVIDLLVEVSVSSDKDDLAADKLDDLCHKVENALMADDSLGGTCDRINLARVDFSYEGEGTKHLHHTAIMNWQVYYVTYLPRNLFDQKTSDFNTIHSEISPNGATIMPTADRTKQEFDLPT